MSRFISSKTAAKDWYISGYGSFSIIDSWILGSGGRRRKEGGVTLEGGGRKIGNHLLCVKEVNPRGRVYTKKRKELQEAEIKKNYVEIMLYSMDKRNSHFAICLTPVSDALEVNQHQN